MNFLNIFYLFVFYSFLGWVIETIFTSTIQKRFVNTGFLDGPFSPIYGFGALIIILFVLPLKTNLFLFFILSIIVSSILEYSTSLIFEKFFNIKWWDYSKELFNINGRISLKHSFFWGILSVFTITFIHPKIIPIAYFLSEHLGIIGSIFFLIFFIIDATKTIISYSNKN